MVPDAASRLHEVPTPLAMSPTDRAVTAARAPEAQQAVAAPTPSPPVAPAVPTPEMVSLRGATFRMGSGDDPSEQPPHAVTVAPFLLAAHATTVREWQRCVEAKACTLPAKGNPDEPVRNVSWDDARGYASWLSGAAGKPYRLPTEAEWEYAARGGAETRYSWGNAMVPGKASCKGCGAPVDPQNPPSVGTYPPNRFGLYAMGGGVAEWVADCWHRDYQGAPRDGSAGWNAPDCRERVLRGGSWVNEAGDLRASSRDYYDASVRYPTHGLRVARSE